VFLHAGVSVPPKKPRPAAQWPEVQPTQESGADWSGAGESFKLVEPSARLAPLRAPMGS